MYRYKVESNRTSQSLYLRPTWLSTALKGGKYLLVHRKFRREMVSKQKIRYILLPCSLYELPQQFTSAHVECPGIAYDMNALRLYSNHHYCYSKSTDEMLETKQAFTKSCTFFPVQCSKFRKP